MFLELAGNTALIEKTDSVFKSRDWDGDGLFVSNLCLKNKQFSSAICIQCWLAG